MKVKVSFNGILKGSSKGSWIFDFTNEEMFKQYVKENKINILRYEILN